MANFDHITPQWVSHLETKAKEVSKELDQAISEELTKKPSIMTEEKK